VEPGIENEIADPEGWAFVRSHVGAACYRLLVRWIPFHRVRQAYLRALGMRIGKQVALLTGTTVMRPERISIGDGTVIGFDCFLGGEAGLTIGSHVNISSFCVLLGGDHDLDSADFRPVRKPIVIEDHAWLATNVTVVGGVRIGRGAVVAAGAVVIRDVPPYHVVAGVPAKKIRERRPEACRYELGYQPWFL
jgi:acetyltransferase-like isoleucine patch superfamily enzyme